MFKRKPKNHDPIVVVVHDGRYDCFGPETARSVFLVKTLEGMGGINESVAPGRYHFYVTRRGFQLLATLEPAPE